MEIISQLESELNKLYGETLTTEIVFDSSCIRQKELWFYAHEWNYKGSNYRCISFGSWKHADIKPNVLNSWDKEQEKDKNFMKAYEAKTLEAKAKISLDVQRKNKECADTWKPIFEKAKKCESHEYLTMKGVLPLGNIRVDHNGVLLIPCYGINGFTGVQKIFKNPETQKMEKKFSYGIKIKGSIFPFKKLEKSKFCYITEGYATGSTIQELYPDIPVVCCFNASNISYAIETIRAKYPEIKICIASDNDHSVTKPIKNPGRHYAWKSSRRYKNVIFKEPKFKTLNEKWTDFNDLAEFQSKDDAKDQLEFFDTEFSSISTLGYNEAGYFYVSSENQQIVCLKADKHNKPNLRRLISSGEYWAKNYGIEIDERIVVDWDSVAEDLIGKCHEKGIFDPTRVRGVGVWKDGDKYVINDGDRVFNANESSKFQYQKTIPIDYSLKEEKQEDMLHLLEAFKSLEYKNEQDYFYLSAWFVQSQIFSVLPWRFHIWVSGQAGTGKSTILKWLHSLSINTILTNNTTGAGVRQKVKSDAVPVIFDESEPTSEKTLQVIDLAREMSSNGEYETLRGSISGNVINYNTQCIFCFGSIQAHQFNQADSSRIYLIELASIENQDNEIFLEISDRFEYFIKNKNRIFTTIFNNINNILWNTKFCKSYLKSEYKLESRLADQLSVTMACFYVYFNSGRMNKEDFDLIVNKFGLIDSEYTEANQEKEHEKCYLALMSVIVDNYSQTTVAQAIHNIKFSNNQDEESLYDKMLGTHGIKYYPKECQIFIQNKNANIKNKLKEYPDLTRVLKRDPDLLIAEKERKLITQLGYVRGIIIKEKL